MNSFVLKSLRQNSKDQVSIRRDQFSSKLKKSNVDETYLNYKIISIHLTNNDLNCYAQVNTTNLK